MVPRLLREARDRGWWDPLASAPTNRAIDSTTTADPTIVAGVDADTWSRLSLAPRVVAPADPTAGHSVILAAIRDGATVSAAVAAGRVVGLVVDGPPDATGQRALFALGVAPAVRRGGLASRLLASSTATGAVVSLAERDPYDPIDAHDRRRIAERLLGSAGFDVIRAEDPVGTIDPISIRAVRRAQG